MEAKWADALNKVPPKKVRVEIEPVYSGTSQRPDSFKIRYTIEGRKEAEKEIKNKNEGKMN